MKTRPMLFKGPMVRAILAGGKTQTRRIVKLPVIDRYGTGCEIAGCELNSCLQQGLEICPYGKPGDRLWVRETFLWRANRLIPVYRANMEPAEAAGFGAMYGGWEPSIFMPRSASRITLEITGVRVERLQDISSEDAKAEGVTTNMADVTPGEDAVAWSYIDGYKWLWESINGKGSWARNEWVWVIEFKKL